MPTVGAGTMRTAAVLARMPDAMRGLPCGYAIRYFADHGQAWTFVGETDQWN